MQAKCAHMFYKQNADGSGVDYILDEKNYAATGAVKYLVFAENWCDFNGAANTNTCLQIIYDNSGSTKSESYDVLQSSDTDSFVNVFFLTKFEQQIYVTATDKTIPSWKLPTATPVYSQRCIGFDDQTLLSHLLPTHSELTQKALAKIMNRPIDAVNFTEVLDIMQKIGTKAAQATLPGQ